MAPPNSILAEQEREGLDPRFALSTHPAMDRCKEQEIGAIRTETGREQRRERRGRRNREMETGEEGVGSGQFAVSFTALSLCMSLSHSGLRASKMLKQVQKTSPFLSLSLSPLHLQCDCTRARRPTKKQNKRRRSSTPVVTDWIIRL